MTARVKELVKRRLPGDAARKTPVPDARSQVRLFMGIALGVLAAGSALCGSAWFPTDLNRTEGPGTATVLGAVLWLPVLLTVVLFATLGLRAARLTRYAPVVVGAGVLSWAALFAIGTLPGTIVVLFFVALNIGALWGTWQFVLRYS